MNKFFSLLKKRVDLPSFTEMRLAFYSFSSAEKKIFAVLFTFFLIGATGIFWQLNNKFSTEIPASGGALYEGMVGIPRFANPIIAISDADRDIVSLVYSGLLKFDGKGGLIPDLADYYEISEDGLTYTFFLKEDLKWHDGAKITADDVAFTIKMAQTPMAKSPKRANWEGVNVEVVNERAIKFTLEKPYAPFLENTTIGILPKHIWGGTPPEQLGLSEFNIKPVGSGPYFVKKVSRNSSGIISSYTMESFEKYALGAPHIKKIILQFYNSEDAMIAAYESGAVDAMGSVSPNKIKGIKRSDGIINNISLPRVFGVFFNQNKNKALASAEVRHALNLATDKQKIVDGVLFGYGEAINNPIPPGTLGAIKNDNEFNGYNPEKAIELLEKNGWKINEETGIREKKIKKEVVMLSFSISTSAASDLVETANILRELWEQIGAKVEVRIYEIGDFDKDVIRARDYDALLFGEVVGLDPDPFAFWHSSQRNDPGLNIALYASIASDKLLEEARKITDPEKRAEKYVAFQEELANDAPAVFVYSPHYIYITPSNVKGTNTFNITVPSGRFSQIQKWYIDTEKTWKFLAD